MRSDERRKEIISMFRGGAMPLSGGRLSEEFGVSRQIIVQDIALLRAQGYDIISTNRGYLLKKTASVSKVFHVTHSDAQIEEELNCIVDLGGCVKDVFVIHEVYGRIRGELEISSRRQVKNFLENIKNGVSSPLKNVTGGSHYHTVEAESEEILDEIAKELKKRKMLLEDSL